MTPRRGPAILGRPWLIVVAWFVVAAALALWLFRTPEGLLRDQLRRWQFWVLELQFVLALVLAAVNLPRFVRSLGLTRSDYVSAALVSALSLVLVTQIAPRTNRIYYDEHIYQSVGQNLADLRLAQMCNDGNVEYGMVQCWRGEYNKEPYGYPHLLSVAYRLVGVRESAAFALNAIAAALMVWVVYLLGTALTGSPRAGTYAALVAALIPEQLRWSHTAAAEPSAALACAVAVLAAVGFVRLRTTAALLWMVAATVFAAQFRPECALVGVVVVAVVLLYAPNELLRGRMWWAALGGVLLAALYFGHMVAVRNEGWGSVGPKFSTMYLPANLRVNGGFFLGDPRFPIAYTMLAAAGLMLWHERRAALATCLYFMAFWGVFLFFYAGSYNYGADDRFSLMAYPPVALMAGVGTWALTETVKRRALWSSRVVTALAIAGLAAQFTWYLPFVRAVGEEAWAARADVKFARGFAGELPANSILLTHNPNMFHLWGQSAAQTSIAVGEPEYVRNVLTPRYAGGIFFHWNFWCEVADPVQQAFCTGVLDRFPHTAIQEYRERDYRYGLYRLDIESHAK
jgi:hypothetical protein